MISTPVMLNGKKKVLLHSINNVLLMFVVRWILLNGLEYRMDEMSSH